MKWRTPVILIASLVVSIGGWRSNALARTSMDTYKYPLNWCTLVDEWSGEEEPCETWEPSGAGAVEICRTCEWECVERDQQEQPIGDPWIERQCIFGSEEQGASSCTDLGYDSECPEGPLSENG